MYEPQDKNTPAVVIAFSFDVCVSQEEDREDDGDDVPAGENQAIGGIASQV